MKLKGNASSHHFRDAVYVGVAVTGAVLRVSERRVRQLCEQHQLDGAILVNGGWLIPLPIKRLETT